MTAVNRYGWFILIGGLAVAGILLAVADIAVGDKWPNPMERVIVGPAATVKQQLHTVPLRFDRTRAGENIVFESPIVGFGPVSPYAALRAFLTNGAGLVLLALAGLILFPRRARNAVERLEGSSGVVIVLAAGLVLAVLTVAALTLLRFTLLFLAVVPLVAAVVLVAALFGIGCISLALGRLFHRRLHLPSVHPLVAALAGALLVFDLAVIPYAGVIAFGAIAAAGMGLAVVTRFGSASGWSFVDLDW